MQIGLLRATPPAVDTDALILIETEGNRRADLAGPLAALYDSGEISGKFLEFTLLHGVEGFKARRVLVAGGGKAGKLDAAAAGKLAGAALRFLRGKGVKSVAIEAPDATVAAIAESAVAGLWEPDVHKTEGKEPAKAIDSVSILAASADPALDAAFERGRVIGEARNTSRDIAVEPPNLLTPTTLAARARAVCEANGLSCDVLDQDRMRQLGMGALLGVAQGSAEPPAMIVMQYKPENPIPGAHLGLIGKGVTFDTGGISIKPAEGMEKMKYDMAGGAAVIGAMEAIAKLKPGVTVTGVVPTVENMPGSRAQRPGDIVKSLNGKTVEVINTDAEGRMILIDALEYAKRLGCTHLTDAATLTGAIVVALGPTSSGVYTNNDEFLGQFMAAAKESGEKMWHMPLDDEYRDQLKSVYADLQNIGTRWGGACTAAMFLREFVGDTPWIHADVAGTAWLDDAKPWLAKGPTGIPLGTYVNLALNWK